MFRMHSNYGLVGYSGISQKRLSQGRVSIKNQFVSSKLVNKFALLCTIIMSCFIYRPRYVVWVSKDKSFNSPSTTRHVANEHQFKFEGLIKDDSVYYVAVSSMDTDGFESPRSAPMTLKNTGNMQ